MPDVPIRWMGHGEGSVDSTGLLKGGYAGYVHVYAMAAADSTKPVLGEAVIRVLPLPASRIQIHPGPAKIPHKAGGYGKSSLAGEPAFPMRQDTLRFSARCLAAIGHELVLHSLALVESTKASALHRRDMDKNVLVAGGGPNEPEAFRPLWWP